MMLNCNIKELTTEALKAKLDSFRMRMFDTEIEFEKAEKLFNINKNIYNEALKDYNELEKELENRETQLAPLLVMI